MISPKLRKILYGGDYNPDQWPKEIRQEDMRLFHLAHIDIVTLPVFSWTLLQPSEDQYEFGWLDEILESLQTNSIYVCMATSTGAHPAWMAKKYPDILQVDFQGRKHVYGLRHNSCPNSPTFRKFSKLLARKLAERYKNHPGLVVWHVNNEFGGPCYCENCAKAFRVWLKERYGDLRTLNERWNTAFWSHQFGDWDEIVPPNTVSEYKDNGQTVFQSIALDYSRFASDSRLACFRNEADILRAITPKIPVTTNLMGFFPDLDYFRWAPHMDIISWDSYPARKTPPSHTAMAHELMRGLKKGAPVMLMEQTPSQLNWTPYNEMKRPGMMRLLSYQAVARGADTIMFFQMRQSRGACEKFHGAVIAHCGHENTRVFREVAQLGTELEKIGDAILDSRADSKAAIIFDWENWWGIELSSGPSIDLKYIPQVQKYYDAFWKLGVSVDLAHPSFDIDKYRIVVAPVLYLMQPGFAEKIEKFVKDGGTFVTTFWSGIVDENDRVHLGGYPGPLRKILGIWAEEIDALHPDEGNEIVLTKQLGALSNRYGCRLLCDLIHSEGAEVLATYGKDFYAGRPALTCNRFGRGNAWYVATDPEQAFLDGLVSELCDKAGVKPILTPPQGVEVAERSKGDRRFVFVLNHNADPVTMTGLKGKDLITGREISGTIHLAGRDVLILEIKN